MNPHLHDAILLALNYTTPKIDVKVTSAENR